ncbi:MAG TPA: hypothetical protein VGP89_11770 [Candidatus Angelobacter sp.]|jgi:hypothetical protein|nr:hypothetical protein [Candidatus Angelobacter sp.]
MFLACFLLIIAIIGGTLLTFLFDRTAPRGARLCMGAAIGLALMATVGFLLALVLGLGAASIILTSVILLLPLLLLAKRERRAVILYLLSPRPSVARGSNAQGIGYLIFYLAIAVLLAMVFSRAAFERPEGIYTGVTNNLGDLPLHLQVINSFAQGHNLPPEDPTFAGVRFAYPFLVDFLAAMLVRAGAGLIFAMWLQNMVLALAFVGLLHYWTVLLTRNRLAGLIAPLLVLFSGGLGWWLLFSDGGGDNFFSSLANLQHDYTIVPNSVLRWGNSLTTLFVPQRSILFGAPLAITIFCQWWLALLQQDAAVYVADPTATSALEQQHATGARIAKSRSKRSRKPAAAVLLPEPQNFYLRRMLAAGMCAGLLPLIHAHTFLVVMAVAACMALIFRSAWRSWLYFFAAALVVSAPEVLGLANTGGVNTRSYIGWQPGWDHGPHNIVWFWFVNTGLFIPLLVVALLWRRATFKLPARLLKFYAPFILCFIVPNLVKVAPWVWDNIKVLFLWYVASTPMVAWLLARWWQQRSFLRWLTLPVLAILLLAGALDVFRVVSEASEYQEFDAHGIAAASLISAQSSPRALVLHAPTYNSPVFLTGRRSLLGYPGWMWSRGLDYSQRNRDIERIYSGGLEAEALLRQYNVDYVLIGPLELAAFRVNEQFWSKYKRVSPPGAYRVYQIRDISK